MTIPEVEPQVIIDAMRAFDEQLQDAKERLRRSLLPSLGFHIIHGLRG